MEVVVEVDIIGEHSIENPEGLNDLGKDGEVEDWGLCMIPPPRIVSSGLMVIMCSRIVAVKAIGLFNGEVLRYLTKMTLTHSVPLNIIYFTKIHLSMYST